VAVVNLMPRIVARQVLEDPKAFFTRRIDEFENLALLLSITGQGETAARVWRLIGQARRLRRHLDNDGLRAYGAEARELAKDLERLAANGFELAEPTP
jgi:hypothetical protein